MRQLDQIAAGTHAAVAGNYRSNLSVEQFDKDADDIRMYAGTGLSECLDAGDHRSPHTIDRKGLPGSGCMTANDVVLQIFQIAFLDSILSHGAETRIDAVNNFVRGEIHKETVAGFYFLQHLWARLDLFVVGQNARNIIQCQNFINIDHNYRT